MRGFSKIVKMVVAALVITSVLPVHAAETDRKILNKDARSTNTVPDDTTKVNVVDISKMSREEYERYLLTAKVDTTRKDTMMVAFSVHVLARPKGDRVLLRWAPDEFAPWYLANKYGYNLLRINEESVIDTLKKGMLPMPLETMKQHFAPTDSLAGAMAQMLYGKGTGLNNAIGNDGADGIMQVYEEQQTRFAYAMLLAEIRPDLAEAMALMYIDSTARKGKEYTYYVTTNIPRKELTMVYQPATVKNVKTNPPHFEPVITDSIGTDGYSTRIFWPMNPMYSSYDIECRFNGGEWKKLNKNRFMTLITYEDESVAQNIYENANLVPGTYEYRICGYDSFGEKSNYSKIHKVEMPDILPPTAPVIKKFYVERPTENTILADIIWEKNNIEPDFKGYNIYYYNPQLDSIWVKLNDKLLAPQDTIFRCEVTYLGTGRVTVVALDTLDNASPSMPQELFIADFTPPSPPKGLEYVMSPTGSVLIKWEKSPDPDVAGYNLYYANDTTHTFLQKAGRMTRNTMIFDTLKVTGVAQRFTYYRVKAFDYSGNESKFSDILTVKRKNYDAPRPCRIDSTWMDEERVYMTWFPSSEFDVDKFYIYRRMHGDEFNSLIGVYTKDSIRNGRLHISDAPVPNRQKRYYYHIETINETGITSEPSAETSFLFKGSTVYPLAIKIGAGYRADDDKVYIGWDISGLTQEMIDDGAYICIYKMWSDDDIFRHIESLSIDKRNTIDHHMKPGDEAEYRVRVRSKNGKISPYSNTVKVTVPSKEK